MSMAIATGADVATTASLALASLPLFTFAYAYAIYPASLWVLARTFGRRQRSHRFVDWPRITITLPVYNEERALRSSLEHVLALDYPPDRRHVLVISDASTDGTDAIAREFAARGVELVRLPRRGGKTAAENAAALHLRGDIVVNIDATARPAPGALKRLIGAFADPGVGVASGRDVSTGSGTLDVNSGESRYVEYEMWVRGLETRLGSIVGASGCFYAMRATLYQAQFPEALSRDFASALIAREHGLRAVSVEEAVCGVPRAGSLDAEFHRKVRTMHRGLETLWYKRSLLNPRVHGRFAFMLFSHKLCRWLVSLTLPLGAVGLLLLAAIWVGAAWFLLASIVVFGVSAMARSRRNASHLARTLALPSYLIMANAAGFLAWLYAFRRQREAMWEPTRRPV